MGCSAREIYILFTFYGPSREAKSNAMSAPTTAPPTTTAAAADAIDMKRYDRQLRLWGEHGRRGTLFGVIRESGRGMRRAMLARRAGAHRGSCSSWEK